MCSMIIIMKSLAFGQRVCADVTRLANLCVRRPVSCRQKGGSASIGCRFIKHSSYNHVTWGTVNSGYIPMNLMTFLSLGLLLL